MRLSGLLTCAWAVGCTIADVVLPDEHSLASKRHVFPQIPDYSKALKLTKRNLEVLESLLPHGELSVMDPRRHYVIITGVLAVVVEYLNSDCTTADYDHEYVPAVDRVLPVVWEQPQLAVDRIETFIKDVKQSIYTIQIISDYYCRKVRAKTCNAIISAVAYEKEQYQDSLELLILLGELAEIYESNRYVDEAQRFDEVALLLRGQEELKPLVMKAAEVYNKLYGKRCVLK